METGPHGLHKLPMPRHDHRCQACQQAFEAPTIDVAACPTCGSPQVIWVPQVHTPQFKSFWHPHLGHEPVHITSAKQLDRELESRHLTLREAPRRERHQRLPETEQEARSV